MTFTTLYLMRGEEKLGTKDIRMIGLAVFGKDKGRKELLRYMKDIASSQNVC